MPAGTSAHTPKSAPPVVLTIAGFDPSSGAGITADLQVFSAHGLFGTACITALTVQSTLGVASVYPVSHLIGATLDELYRDVPPTGIKIGMLGDLAGVLAVAGFLRHTVHDGCPIVLDPVLVSSSGAPLLSVEGIAALHAHLLPLVSWITPNLAELGALAGVETGTPAGFSAALESLHQRHPHLSIVATGGDQTPPTDILLTPQGETLRFVGEHVETTSTHGTGCAFSSALLSRLVLGDAPEAAVAASKAYVTEALRRAPGVGLGKGPLGLLWTLQGPS